MEQPTSAYPGFVDIFVTRGRRFQSELKSLEQDESCNDILGHSHHCFLPSHPFLAPQTRVRHFLSCPELKF